MGPAAAHQAAQQQQLSDFVGEHGPYQLILTVILFLRYVLLGLMANSGSLMAPDVTFYCDLPMEEIVAIMPNITLLNQTEQALEIREEFKQICQLDLHLYQQAYLNATLQVIAANQKNRVPNATLAAQLKKQARRFNLTTRIRECTDFTYDIAPDQGKTMTSEFDLVCERDWLRSLFQSLISAAIVVAHVFWGTFSDNYGRYKAQKICLLVSLLAGCLSVLPVDFWTFTIARALCSFGDLGLVVSLTTTVVELVGSQYRGLSVALVNFGYALGVTVLPYIFAYFEDFRVVVSFTVFCHLLTVPFILTTNESVRWLLTNRKFKLARRELKRISRFNRSVQCCCFIWPLNKLFTSSSSSSYAQVQQPISRTISSEESKLAFDLLFKKFIEQIESQKLCDPEQEFSSGTTTKGRSNCDRCDSNATTTCSTEEPSVAADANADFEDIVILSPAASPRNDEAANTLTRLPSAAGTRDTDTTTLCNSRLALTKSNSTKSNSCGQLSAAAAPIRQEPMPAINKAHIRQKSSSTGLLTDDAFDTSQVDYRRRIEPQLRQPTYRAAAAAAEDHTILKRRVGECHQPDCINLVAHQLSFMGRVSRLFKDKTLMIAVFTIVWTTFNSELTYTSFIIINLEVGEDVYLNYMLGGCMEALAAITASLLLSYASRRHSLICFWLLISASCFGLAVAHIDSTWAVWLLAVAKFSQSCLSSIASVAAYEAFPTFLRQSGSGLVFTLGGLGSVFAPLIFAEFDDHAGMDRVLMTFSASSLTAATLIYLFLKETRNCELQ